MTGYMVNLITNHCGGTIATSFIVVCFILEKCPIKFNPITAILSWFGRMINKDLTDVVNRISKHQMEIDNKIDENRIDELKTRIQEFARNLAQADARGLPDVVVEEEYDKIFENYDEYERLLASHGRTNGKTARSMGIIKQHYNAKGYGVIE